MHRSALAAGGLAAVFTLAGIGPAGAESGPGQPVLGAHAGDSARVAGDSAAPPSGEAAVPRDGGVYFRDAFNGPTRAWSNVVARWSVSGGHLRAQGLPGRLNAVKRTGQYADFVYDVRMNRAGNGNGGDANCLVTRGRQVHTARGPMMSGYYFCYTNNGSALIAYIDPHGEVDYLMEPVRMPEVIGNGGGYRTVTVQMRGARYAFHVNKYPIYEAVAEKGLPLRGQVGIAFDLSSGQRATMAVDSAALYRAEPASAGASAGS